MARENPTRGIDYDLLVNWPKRLEREGPFFKELFRESGVRRVLDLACGTGRHAALFAGWGLQVVALDASADMIDRARGNFGSLAIDLLVADMRSAGSLFDEGSFDACVCLGNALPCLDGVDEITSALTAVRAILRGDGLLVLHMLNFDRFSKERRIEGPRPGNHPSRDVLFLKVFEPAGPKVRVTILQIEKTDGWKLTAGEGELSAIAPRELFKCVQRAGLLIEATYADHARTAFDPGSSDNVILIARKPR